MDTLLSRDNRLVKYALKLKTKKYRDLEGKFLAEGIRFIEEGILENCVEYILYSKKLLEVNGNERVLKSTQSLYEVDASVINELCDTKNPQGAVAVVKKPSFSIDDIKNDFIVISDGIQDPGNLGTVIRTCDAAGVGGIAVIKGTVDVFNSKTLRATMGAVFRIPIIYFDSFNSAAEALIENGYNIYASSLSTDDYMYQCDFKNKTALVIGNEANGIPDEHILKCTHKVKIPMPGSAESLNAAVAAGILIYEVVRQRLTK